MKRFLTRFALLFFLAIYLGLPTASVHAQIPDNYVDRPAGEALDRARGISPGINDEELNAQGYGFALTNNSLWTNIICSTITAEVICTNQPAGSEGYNRLMQNTVSGYATRTIAYMYTNPPADLAYWIYDTGKTLGFIRAPVYAQERGIGFSGLEALLPIWKVFRNIAYLLLAIVMVVIGFMIMFRRKIDPKTVVTVQNALPRIIITLILITFSYAIVGLMIDLMYVAILFATILMQQTGLVSFDLNPYQNLKSFLGQMLGGQGLQSLEQVMTTGGLGAVWQLLFPWGFATLTKLSAQLLGWNWSWTAGAGAISVAALFAAFAPIAIIAGTAAAVPILVAVLLSLALIFAFIRLLVMFITAYIQIIFALIIGPIQILTEAIPGSSGFSSWFKNLLANILVFPIATMFFLLSMAFMSIADQGDKIWTPPYASLPGGSVSSIGALFSLGVLFAIPTVVGSIKEAIKAKPLVQAGPGAVVGPVIGTIQTGMGTLSQFYYGKELLKGVGGFLRSRSSEPR
ncbi:hypothetical protein A2154_02290 [Candidatus Gottesmanbacteria bacterium RBG_16_43_7]|uniref:Type IV secretion system protein n=1 Tax=Candidatus Gottesmanbacteria bacterium RBG_16_43_7 TaxID=1798373 RepID=A0A1F5ZB26_9BACT|nr:MAG: hypothetical protein A2154_02290 [Candidatus Gottesmanbacteria bacterium RBG_16_43_7]